MSPPVRRSPKQLLSLAVRGFCMGAADIVPGVSGGTMAFILEIYEELVDSIRTFGTPRFWGALVHGRMREVVEMSNWRFLGAVGCGIAVAILTLSRTLERLLTTQPVLVWSFFFGLVLASALVVAQRVPRWTAGLVVALVLGTVAAYLLVGLVPVETPDAPWFLVLSGAIAICAMILPGISGSFLLVILGKYEFVLNAVNTRDVVSVGYVGLGAGVGIIAFAQVLSWLLHRYHDLTIAFLTGLMIGSLRRVWPWKTADGLGRNVLPAFETDMLVGASLMLFGFLLVIALERLAHGKRA